MAKDAPGMLGYRSRNQDGQLRDKRDDTHMGTIEKQYDRDFGVRSDKQLGNFLKENGIASLNAPHTQQSRQEVERGLTAKGVGHL